MNVVLIGYRASGKTEVGRRLSQLLGLSFHDTDDLIRGRTGKSVRQIVDEGGWRAFRTAEKAAVETLSGLEGAVIALGGGAVTEPENVAALRDRGLFVWLQVDEATVMERMTNDADNDQMRPPLVDGGMAEEVRATLAERTPIYRAYADLAVDTTGKSPDEVASEIAGAVRALGTGLGSRSDVMKNARRD